MDTETIITAVGTLLGGGLLGSLFTSRGTNAKAYSDSAVALSNAYAVMIDRHERDINRLDARLEQYQTERSALVMELAAARDENKMLRQEIGELRSEVAELRAQRSAA